MRETCGDDFNVLEEHEALHCAMSTVQVCLYLFLCLPLAAGLDVRFVSV